MLDHTGNSSRRQRADDVLLCRLPSAKVNQISRHGGHRTTAAIIVALALSGCTIGGSGSAGLDDSATLVTQLAESRAKASGVARDDTEIIKSAVVAARTPKDVKPLAWANPETGSSGTIVAIENVIGQDGSKCRSFKTTVSTFMGIAFYDGQACQISPGEWVMSWFRSQDAKN